METNDNKLNANILPDEPLKNAVGGSGSTETKYHIGEYLRYYDITHIRYKIVGIGMVDMFGDQKYILDVQEYKKNQKDPHCRPGLLDSDSGDTYSWVSTGLTERFESILDQCFHRI